MCTYLSICDRIYIDQKKQLSRRQGKSRRKKGCMSKEKMEEIVKQVMTESHLRYIDYYESGCFYYLSGRYPDLSISDCVDVIDMIRDRL